MKALGVIFSNLHDKEIKDLTQNRTLASVPFGGRYRLIDFVLSNMVNSGVTKVGIITKENYQSLMDHVGSGKHWDLNRKNGGLILLPPYGERGSTLYRSRFEAIRNIEQFLKRSEEEFVIMSDCDSVCSIDFAPIIKTHAARNAEITVIYRRKTVLDNHECTVFEIDESNKITHTINSDKAYGEQNVYANMLIIGRKFLLGILDNADNRGIKSFSKDVLTRHHEFRIYGHEVMGFFASIDCMASYFRESMELLKKEKREELFYHNGMSIFTKIRDSAPLALGTNASVANSLVADGCVIEGTVKNSILFRGVRVASGAVVENSILFQDSSVGSHSRLNCVIADKESIILERRNLSGHETHPHFIAKNTVI